MKYHIKTTRASVLTPFSEIFARIFVFSAVFPRYASIGKANDAVPAEIGGAEPGSYYSCLASVSGMRK